MTDQKADSFAQALVDNLNRNVKGEHAEHQRRTPQRHMGKMLLILFVTFVLLVIVGGAFYWYEIRPSEIRRNCEAYANSQDAWDTEESNNFYRMCLLRNGMAPESMFVD